MTSKDSNGWWNLRKSFSLLLHFASLIVLIVCVYCIIILFRDLRRLESRVEKIDKYPFQEFEEKKITKRGFENENDLDEYHRDARESSGKRMAPDGVNFGATKLTIVTKDDEKLLLQTTDGSPWVLLPSMTRISLSTLEDFCFTAHQYCVNKNQVLRPISGSNRRSNNEVPRDLAGQHPATNNLPEPSQIHQYATGPSVSKSEEIQTNQVYDGDVASFRHTTLASSLSTKRRKGLGRKKRKRERCFIEKISKPIIMGHRVAFFGSWMQDAAPRDFDAEKAWVTEHVSHTNVLEYASLNDLKSNGNTAVKYHHLPFMFDGTNHIIYNGSILYQKVGSPMIVRYDFRTQNVTETKIAGAAYNGGDYLYNDDSHNYFDLAADENGLWAFFHYEKQKHLSVARLHPKTMRLIKVLNLTTFDHTKIGDTWVTCGVMYVLDSRTQFRSKVSRAYDLFQKKSAIVDLPWQNTYNKTTMVNYNPHMKRLQIYDSGYMLDKNLLIATPRHTGDVVYPYTKDVD